MQQHPDFDEPSEFALSLGRMTERLSGLDLQSASLCAWPSPKTRNEGERRQSMIDSLQDTPASSSPAVESFLLAPGKALPMNPGESEATYA